jgi:hypothetical protein
MGLLYPEAWRITDHIITSVYQHYFFSATIYLREDSNWYYDLETVFVSSRVGSIIKSENA